jgi:integrase
VRKIRHLELIPSSVEDFARDMFMLSFYLRGMSFIDMSFLRRTDLRNGYLSYRRRKTGQLLTIKWTAEMQQIVDKYPQRSPKYLLPIISQNVHNERCAYRNAAYNINRTLKKIATMVGAGIPLTMYVARHTWASIARYKGVPIRVISEGLGHDSESTTQIYLSTLDSTAVDKANSLIISLI